MERDMTPNGLIIRRAGAADKLCEGADMPGELRAAPARRTEALYVLLWGGECAGLALADEGNTAFLTVYIRPRYRRRGLGRAAVRHFENLLCEAGAKTIMCACREDAPDSLDFASRLGYRRAFSSAYMRYTGGGFPAPAVEARPYRDEDYAAAHALYALAFHEMRLGTGDFPDSVPEPPSERMRRHWAGTADERLVCLHVGQIAGYAHIEGNELGSVAIAPALQGRGLGRGFVQYICNMLLSRGESCVNLFCVEGNPARRLYDALGFTVLSVDRYAVKSALDEAGPTRSS